MSSLFLSYRRDDSGAETGRLYDRLVEQFGAANIYRDIDSTPLGADFPGIIRHRVAQCNAMIAVIGPNWFGRRADGLRRIDDPYDWVRIEVTEALKRGVLVVPVLVNGAVMPTTADLPDDLEMLSSRQDVNLSLEGWRSEVEKLVARIDEHINPPAAWARSPLLIAASSGVLSLIGGLVSITVQCYQPNIDSEVQWSIVIATLNGALSAALLAVVVSAARRSVWPLGHTVAVAAVVGAFQNAVLGIAPNSDGYIFVTYPAGFAMSAFAAMVPTYSPQHIVMGTFVGALGGLAVAVDLGSIVVDALSIAVYGILVGAAIAATPRPTRRLL